MTISIKLSEALYQHLFADLKRPHPFAYERVGFAVGRLCSLTNLHDLILLTRYSSIPDEHYERDATVGACINNDGINRAMLDVYNLRDIGAGLFHIHIHNHDGETGMSEVDAVELPRMTMGFRGVGRNSGHGAIIFSRNHGSGWVWLPNKETMEAVDYISIIGPHTKIFRKGV